MTISLWTCPSTRDFIQGLCKKKKNWERKKEIWSKHIRINLMTMGLSQLQLIITKQKRETKEPFTNMSIKSHFWTSVLHYTRNKIILSSVSDKLFHRFLLLVSLKYINYSFNFFFFKRLNMIYCTAYKEGSTELKNKLYCMYRSNAAVWSGEQWQIGSSRQGVLLGSTIIAVLFVPFFQSRPNRVCV